MVLSSAKLHISNSRLMRNESFIKMLKSIGPKAEPCGTPIFIFVVKFYMNQSLPFGIGFLGNYIRADGCHCYVHMPLILVLGDHGADSRRLEIGP